MLKTNHSPREPRVNTSKKIRQYRYSFSLNDRLLAYFEKQIFPLINLDDTQNYVNELCNTIKLLIFRWDAKLIYICYFAPENNLYF